jgi:hypothetical protein
VLEAACKLPVSDTGNVFTDEEKVPSLSEVVNSTSTDEISMPPTPEDAASTLPEAITTPAAASDDLVSSPMTEILPSKVTSDEDEEDVGEVALISGGSSLKRSASEFVQAPVSKYKRR